MPLFGEMHCQSCGYVTMMPVPDEYQDGEAVITHKLCGSGVLFMNTADLAADDPMVVRYSEMQNIVFQKAAQRFIDGD